MGRGCHPCEAMIPSLEDFWKLIEWNLSTSDIDESADNFADHFVEKMVTDHLDTKTGLLALDMNRL